jgi:hypothetical protein
MFLLGALFALFMAGFWLYCLVDVALTPGDECPGLPKAAWIALVGGTFIIGAAVWLAVRRPARPTVLPGPPGHDPGDPSLPRAPQSRGGAVRRHFRPGPRARNGNDPAGGGPGRGDPAGCGPGGGWWGGPGRVQPPRGRGGPAAASGRTVTPAQHLGPVPSEGARRRSPVPQLAQPRHSQRRERRDGRRPGQLIRRGVLSFRAVRYGPGQPGGPSGPPGAHRPSARGTTAAGVSPGPRRSAAR